ncbi:hypothetical protein TNCV_3212811 [Trichonephila clavipes]|nr:hypothetical protein TNCV_3212811 [Trichonephila clavipes]
MLIGSLPFSAQPTSRLSRGIFQNTDKYSPSLSVVRVIHQCFDKSAYRLLRDNLLFYNPGIHAENKEDSFKSVKRLRLEGS